MFKVKNLYSIIFYISRFITVFIFSIFLFSTVNAKFMLSEYFFSTLINFSYAFSFFLINKVFNFNPDFAVSYSLVIDKYYFSVKYFIYKVFCIHSQQIDILLMVFLIIFIFGLTMIIKFRKNSYIYVTASLFIVYFATYIITSLKDFLLLSFIAPIVFIILKIINNNCNFNKILILIPIFGEIFCVAKVLKYIYKNISNQSIKIFVFFVSMIVSNIIFLFLPVKDIQAEQILSTFVYNIHIDKNKIIVSSMPPCIIDKDKKRFFNDYYIGYQDIIYNNQKKEIYVYDYNVGFLYILDVFNRLVKYRIKLDGVPLDIIRARLCCNSDFSILFIAFEGISKETSNLLYLFNLKDYKLLESYSDYPGNDFVIYNKYRNSFLITHYQGTSMVREIDISNKRFKDIDVGFFQGYTALSEKNKEIYIAFHQQGRIGVYDAETMELKRKIKTNYTVKDITYDEDLNVLIAPSYFTGYIDIFLMDGTDKLLTREFIGYELREAKFDYEKENLYICSNHGLYRKKLNIKELIKNVSHETK